MELKGWQDIHDSTSNVTGNPGYTVASGGTETTSGDYKIHTFTASGPLNITNVGHQEEEQIKFHIW